MASEIPRQESALTDSPQLSRAAHPAATSLQQQAATRSERRLIDEKKILTVIVLALLSIVVLGVVQYRWVRQASADSQLVSHTQDVLREIGATQRALNDSEACTQTFLLSETSGPPPGCTELIRSIPSRLQNLRVLTADNAVQQQNIANLDAPAKDIRLGLEAEINMGLTTGTPGPGAPQMEGAVRQSIIRARTLLNDMELAELDLLTQRKATAVQTSRTTGFLIFLGTTAAFLLLSASGAGLYSGMIERRRTEAALAEEEQRFELMVEGVQDYAIFMIDPTGRVITWNKGAERIKHYTAREVIGRNFSIFYPQEDIDAGTPQHNLETAAREGHVESEGWRLRKDGSRFWASVIITARRNANGQLLGFSKVTRDVTEHMQVQAALQQEVTERRAAQQKLGISEKSLRVLSLHLLRTQDEERRRIGRDMHDSLGQYLSVIKMRLDSMVSTEAANPAKTKELNRCVELIEQCIREVRTISYLLYPPMLEEMGLSSAIPWYLEGFSERSQIQTDLQIVPAGFERLPREVELTLFRVLQESLTNVHRHSGSKTAEVKLERTATEVALEVRDHGKGSPREMLEEGAEDWTGTHGVGLRGMNERLQQLGGNLDVTFSDKGTVVRATIPL